MVKMDFDLAKDLFKIYWGSFAICALLAIVSGSIIPILIAVIGVCFIAYIRLWKIKQKKEVKA